MALYGIRRVRGARNGPNHADSGSSLAKMVWFSGIKRLKCFYRTSSVHHPCGLRRLRFTQHPFREKLVFSRESAMSMCPPESSKRAGHIDRTAPNDLIPSAKERIHHDPSLGRFAIHYLTAPPVKKKHRSFLDLSSVDTKRSSQTFLGLRFCGALPKGSETGTVAAFLGFFRARSSSEPISAPEVKTQAMRTKWALS